MLMILFGVLAAVSIGGLITTAVIGAAADKYGSYGEVPIPGAGEIRLPEGETIVSFHVFGYGGRGLGVPPAELRHHTAAGRCRSDGDRRPRRDGLGQ